MSGQGSMLDSLRGKRRSSSYYEARRREGDRDYDQGYSSQERSDRDRGYVYRSQSRTPPSRAPAPPPVHVSRPPETSRHRQSSHSSRSDSHRQTEVVDPSTTAQAVVEPTGEEAMRRAQLKKDFPDICFDGFVFPPRLKRVPTSVETTVHDYVADIFFQCQEWSKTAKKASKVAFDRAVMIKKLEKELGQKDRIIQALNSEAESSRKFEIEALKKADEAQAAMDRMKREHYATVEDMGHRNTIVTAERDAALKELNELKSKFSEIIKEKDAANVAAQEACDQAVVLRRERDAAMEKVREVEAGVDEKVRQAETRLEADIEELLVTYNANVLRHRNLAWLDDYSTQLYNAWNLLVEEERAVLSGGAFDEFELENRILSEDEKKVLHDSMISHARERLGTQHLEIGEGSGVEHSAISSEIVTSSRSEPTPVI